MTLHLYPIWIVDLAGSTLMILFSFLCVHAARRLTRGNPKNVVFTYLLWLSVSLALFAISRSVGHIIKRILLTFDHKDLWEVLKPYSGSTNTLMFVLVASFTLFFDRVWRIYELMSKDKLALESARDELLFLNRNLENLVSERTRDLADSESKYRRIFEASQDAILAVSPAWFIVDVNPAARELLGIPAPKAPPGSVGFRDLFNDKSVASRVEEDIVSHGHLSDVELQLLTADGSTASVLLSGKVDRNEDGQIAMIHFLVKDISQRITMERQLLQADKLASIGQLASGIAHEINNPLSMVLGYTQLLLRQEETGSQKHSDLKTIEKHARNCKNIVGDLLSFARSTRTRKEMASIATTIEEVAAVVKNHFELDGITIFKEFDSEVPRLLMDDEKIKQVVMNLVMNAKQAIGKNGLIRISLNHDKPRGVVSIRVEDNGCGIPQEHLSRIFDPFFTTKKTGEGTGLGLSVSYGIVRDHGGEILVESHPGKGTTFVVNLPATREHTSEGGPHAR